jgi:alkylation response protein AidB-like acyl-CoA dehydrogenase
MSDISVGTASEKEARDVAEAARETEWANPSFVRELFLGRFRLDLIHPHPPADAAEEARAKPFMDKLRAFMERVDSEEIDRTGEIPEALIQELREIGAFGIKIPKEYGGLGLSQMSYIRAIEMVTSKDGSITALLSAHQSIGVPQPLKLFGGTEAQVFPAPGQGRDLRVRAHRGRRRLRSSQHAVHRDSDRRREALRHQWREAVVH